jgi:hypothetical protein
VPRFRRRAAGTGAGRRGRRRHRVRQLTPAARPRRGGGRPGWPGHQDRAWRHAGPERFRRRQLRSRLQPGVERLLSRPGPGLARVLPRATPGGLAAGRIHQPGLVRLRHRGAGYAGRVHRPPPHPLLHPRPARRRAPARLRRWPDRVQPHADRADRRPAGGRLQPDAPGRGAASGRRHRQVYAWILRHQRRQAASPLTSRGSPRSRSRTGRAPARPARAGPRAASEPPAGTRPRRKPRAPRRRPGCP